jgi:hypothetical protein
VPTIKTPTNPTTTKPKNIFLIFILNLLRH